MRGVKSVIIAKFSSARGAARRRAHRAGHFVILNGVRDVKNPGIRDPFASLRVTGRASPARYSLTTLSVFATYGRSRIVTVSHALRAILSTLRP
jgi:hypothetical protein